MLKCKDKKNVANRLNLSIGNIFFEFSPKNQFFVSNSSSFYPFQDFLRAFLQKYHFLIKIIS
ncbi:MAG: hypothetical protein EAZ97_12740 [Bacteroidetes bacterium]|nr:MAG: hypothetical protein EAZ97_12740 [Bacteroidota bacterium]